jgi:hypothetical protein
VIGWTRPRLVLTLVIASALVIAGGTAAWFMTGPDSGPQPVWTTPLDDDAELAPDSEENARRLAAQARYTLESEPVAGHYPEGFQSVIKESEFSVPVYVVPEDQPTSKVVWVDDDRVPHPEGIGNGLQETFDEVPLPTGVAQLQADGSDGHLVIHQPSTDRLWEFWTFEATGPDGQGPYTAGYGARIDEVSQHDGVLPNRWGARATSLSLLGGVMRMQDYTKGSFDYALALAVPVVSDDVVPPATRTDGPSSATPSGAMDDAVSAGMRFRLPADYDCDALDDPTPLLVMICRAVRDYGMLVIDRTGGTVTLYAEDDRTVGTPWSPVETSPWPDVEREFAGVGSALTRFPWEDLQQVAPPPRVPAG